MMWEKYLNLRNILQYKAKLKLISLFADFEHVIAFQSFFAFISPIFVLPYPSPVNEIFPARERAIYKQMLIS